MEKREKIQREALALWLNSGKKGTLELITGLGKTKIAMDAVKLLPTRAKILFLAETTTRKQDMLVEQYKWGCAMYSIEFACYQSAYKWKDTEWDLVIADEIHDSLTKEYSKFYANNKYESLLGLSATVDRRAMVDEEEAILKGHLLDELCPVVYKYSMDDGQVDGTARELDVYVINHELDSTALTITGGSKDVPFLQTEKAAYDYRDEQFRKCMYLPEHIKNFRFRTTSAARARLLYELPSKVDATKKLMESLPGKTIIFGNSIDSLEKITDNVVSSRNTDAYNTELRAKFDAGKINVIASFKKLKQGANLKGLDNVVIHSYYGKTKDLIQRIGRLRQNGEVGRVFIFITFGTQEQKWFDGMWEDISITKIPCRSVEDCVSKIR